MSGRDYYKPGDWNAACSMCGAKFKASELTQNWQGQYRCQRCQESRHPQDFVRATKDEQSVQFAQPEQDVYVQYCTLNGNSALPGLATPDCSIPDNDVYNIEAS